MKLAIMQPYFFPYLGYFHLLHAADRFVVYDDVAYIRNGWINRNRLLLNGQPHYFTVPVAGASSHAPIHDTRVDASDPRWRRRMLATFRQAYARAPFAADGLRLVERVLESANESIGDLARESIVAVAEHLGLGRSIVATSRTYGNSALKGPRRVLDICRREGATTYVNAPGGRDLYRAGDFEAAGIELRFVAGRLPSYPQGGGPFVPGLSILDAIMWRPPGEVSTMLAQYELEQPPARPAPSTP